MNHYNQHEFGGKDLPKKLSMYFSPGEVLLFKVKNISDRTIEWIFFFGMLGPFIFMFLFFGLFTNFDPIIWLIPILIIIPVCMLISRPFKNDQVLVMTDKRIYLYTKTQKSDSIESIYFPILRAVIFRKRKILERIKGRGTIDFISLDSKTSKISINNVPNITDCQKIIESILYVYGNLQERWDHIKMQLDFQFPYSIAISDDGLEQIRTRNQRLNIYLAIILGITIMCALLFYYYLPVIAITICIIMMGVIISLIPLSEKYISQKGKLPKTSILSFDSERITLTTNNTPIYFPITPETGLNYYKITQLMGRFSFRPEEYKYTHVQWDTDQLGLIIQSSYDGPSAITFGPIDKFPEIFELFFCYFINWKGEHNLLLSKDDLIKLEGVEPITIFEERKGDLTTITPPIKISDERFQQISSLSYELQSEINPFLEPEEKIIIYFKPRIAPTIRIITLILSLIGISFGIISTISFPIYLVGFPLSNFILYPSITAFVFNIPYILGEHLINNSIYIFTNKKLILKYSKSYVTNHHVNLSAILRRNKKQIYNIELSLKNPVKNIPFTIRCLMALKYNIYNRPTIIVPEVPYNNNLLEQINYLRDNPFQ